MNRPAITATIEITLDSDNDTYKTKSFLEVAEEFANDNIELPRDVLLGMICELDVMASKIRNRAEVTEKEMNDYRRQRKLISSETDEDEPKPPSKQKKKDAIDNSIDHLFDEDNEDNSGL